MISALTMDHSQWLKCWTGCGLGHYFTFTGLSLVNLIYTNSTGILWTYQKTGWGYWRTWRWPRSRLDSSRTSWCRNNNDEFSSVIYNFYDALNMSSALIGRCGVNIFYKALKQRSAKNWTSLHEKLAMKF